MIPPRAEPVRQKPVHSILMRDGFWLCGNPDSYMFKTLARNRSWEPHVGVAIGKHLRRGWTFIDVGAGLGFWTMYASRKVGDSGRVIAFEPCIENYRFTLMAVERARRKNVSLYPVAVNDGLRLAWLWQNPDNDGDNRLDGQDGACVVTASLDELLANELTAVTSTMQPWRVMLKIDVQGYEPEVLFGATRLMFQFRPVVIAEEAVEIGRLKKGDVATILAESGYDVEYIKTAEGKESRDVLGIPRRR